MDTKSTQDNLVFDMLSLFDEQFDIRDFKNSVMETENQSDVVLHKTKHSIQSAIHNAENLEDKAKYVVDMDDDILDSIEKGNLKLVTSKDGNIYAQLRNSNGKFGERLPIKRELEESGITANELQMSLQVKAIEEQLHKIVDVLADIDVKVTGVLQGQHNDRKGLFYSGLSLFIEAKQVGDEQLKKEMIAQALKSLNDANYQMIQEIRSGIGYLVTEQYKKSKRSASVIDEKISEIYKCYEVVYRAAFVKAAIYQDCGELSAMLTAIDEYGRFIQRMIVPFAGRLSELDRNNRLIESGTWGTMAKTLEGCSELKQKLAMQRVYQLCAEDMENG